MTHSDQSGIREVSITLPARDDQLDFLQLGDAVFLDGLVFTGREGLYHMIFEKGKLQELIKKRALKQPLIFRSY